MRSAGCAQPEERNRMTLNREICSGAERGKLLGRNADIDINHAVTTGAGQVMVVLVATTDTVTVRAIGKLNAIQQASVDQHFNRAIYRSTAQARLGLAQILPEVVHRKISPATREFSQALSNNASWTRCALAFLVKHGKYFLGNHVRGILSHGMTGRESCSCCILPQNNREVYLLILKPYEPSQMFLRDGKASLC